MRYIAIASFLSSAVLNDFLFEFVFAVPIDRWNEDGTWDDGFSQQMSNQNDGHWHVAVPRRTSTLALRAELRRQLRAEATDQGWLPLDVRVA